MPRPSVIPAIKERLERYLEQVDAAYDCQAESDRMPTLPHTNDYKANVTAIGRAIGLKDTQRKYLHEHVELRSLIDLVADGQGLGLIGARLSTQEDSDEALKARMRLQAKMAKEDAQAAAMASAQVASLMESLDIAYKQIAELSTEVQRYRAQIELMQSGIFVKVD